MDVITFLLVKCEINLVLILFICRVLYFSIHRYEHGQFWPNLRQSDYDYVGKGAAVGYNINVPLNKVRKCLPWSLFT